MGLAWGACLAALFALACGPAVPDPIVDLPERPSDAPTGEEVARAVRGLNIEAREARIYTEIAQGNVPEWSRRMRRVDMRREVDGSEHEVSFWATPDYLAVGSDTAFFLFPLSPQTGQRVADLVNASLPTVPMVDAVWARARRRLAPITIEPDRDMTTVEYFEHHENLVQGQRMLQTVPRGALVAGHKKDVVLSTTLSANPGRVAIYGWHRLDGRPIQVLSTVLNDTWVDYSHGIRLVDRTVLIDGERRDLAEVLRDPSLAPLFSDGGVITSARYPLQRTGGW